MCYCDSRANMPDRGFYTFHWFAPFEPTSARAAVSVKQSFRLVADYEHGHQEGLER